MRISNRREHGNKNPQTFAASNGSTKNTDTPRTTCDLASRPPLGRGAQNMRFHVETCLQEAAAG